MNAYSVDLRERVVAAVERGVARSIVAEQFQVSLPTIKRWLLRWRTTGTLARTPHPGPPSVTMAAVRARALPLLEARPDATLADHCRAFADQHGITVSRATMCRVIARDFGWTRKKSR